MIHDASPRKAAPFVELNCGALPEGAAGARTGRFLAADKGTLFLDEIGASTPALQLKLLRVLQERRFEPVGSEDSIEVDVRLILATNEDLSKAVAEGRFRQDLYYRISVVPIHLPSLRERIGDVPLLAQHFLRRFATDNAKKVLDIDDSTMTILQAHAWPGNIRELENVIERGVILTRGEILMPGDLPPELTKSAPAPTGDRTLALKRALEIPEREIIERTLRAHDWNRQRTASALDINRTTLFNKMRKYGLLGGRMGRAVNV